MNPIGIMQGRLSPPVNGRIQSFPVDTWRKEFTLARQAGLDCIEWIYEAETEAINPLRSDEALIEIRRLAENSGVPVWSVCADYYMAEQLVLPDGTLSNANIQHLFWLISQTRLLGARYIVLPFVDSCSLKSPEEIEGLIKVLRVVVPAAESAEVELHLETDLLPEDLVAVLECLSHPMIRANYDIGNSASLAHHPSKELRLLGPWLGSVHVKDRVRGGDTVPLGTGAADFATCFRLICAAGFNGPFILQAAREIGLSELELAIRNRRFVQEQLMAAEIGR